MMTVSAREPSRQDHARYAAVWVFLSASLLGIPTSAATLVIGGAEFKPAGDGGAYSANGVQLYNYEESAVAVFLAPVKLPIGSTVTGLECIIDDGSTSYAISVSLNRYQISTGSSGINTMANVSTGVASAPGRVKISDTSVSVPVIDDLDNNFHYQYFLRANVPASCWDGAGGNGGGGNPTNCFLHACAITY